MSTHSSDSGPSGIDRKLVLVIDDDTSIQKLIRDMLERKFYLVVTANSAEEGVRISQTHKLDLIITDIFMAGQGGLWVIEKIKQQSPEIKIIAISGGWLNLNATDVVRAAKKIGADWGITKPFDITDLQSKVEELVGPALQINM